MPEAWRDETGNTHRRVLLFSVAVGKGGRTVDVGIADSRPPLPSGRTAEPVTFSANVGEYGARSVTDDLYGARRFASEKLAVQRGVIEELAAQAQVALGEAALQGVAADGIAGAAPDTSIAG